MAVASSASGVSEASEESPSGATSSGSVGAASSGTSGVGAPGSPSGASSTTTASTMSSSSEFATSGSSGAGSHASASDASTKAVGGSSVSAGPASHSCGASCSGLAVPVSTTSASTVSDSVVGASVCTQAGTSKTGSCAGAGGVASGGSPAPDPGSGVPSGSVAPAGSLGEPMGAETGSSGSTGRSHGYWVIGVSLSSRVLAGKLHCCSHPGDRQQGDPRALPLSRAGSLRRDALIECPRPGWPGRTAARNSSGGTHRFPRRHRPCGLKRSILMKPLAGSVSTEEGSALFSGPGRQW